MVACCSTLARPGFVRAPIQTAKLAPEQVLEIKRLNTAIAALRSEMNKYEEQLEDCRKFKEFMDGITPSGE